MRVHRFEALVEREWLQAGHAFHERCARSAFAVTKKRSEAPTFLLFIDCVWQVRAASGGYQCLQDAFVDYMQLAFNYDLVTAIINYSCSHFPLDLDAVSVVV